MNWVYLAALLLSMLGVGLLDWRYQLVLFRAPLRAVVVVAVGLAVLLAWDFVGISAGVFIRGDGPWLLGWDLANQLPVEEPVFLLFLSYLTLALYAGALHWWERRRARAGGRGRA